MIKLAHYLANQPYILLLLAPFIWGGNAVVGRLAVNDMAPFTMTSLRWLTTLLMLLPFALRHLKRDWVAIRQHQWLLLGYGMVGFASFNLLLYLSLHYTTAVNVTLIQAVIPMIILLFNKLLFHEPLKRLQLVGLLFAFTGVVFIITQGKPATIFTLSVNQGDAMMLVAAVLYAMYSMGLRFKPPISWLSFITVSSAGAFVTTVPFVAYELFTQPKVVTASYQSLLVILYMALFASLIAQLAFAKGVSLVGANRAGLAINLVPIFGALLAVLVLHEAFHWYHVLALTLVLGGIALSEYAVKN